MRFGDLQQQVLERKRAADLVMQGINQGVEMVVVGNGGKEELKFGLEQNWFPLQNASHTCPRLQTKMACPGLVKTRLELLATTCLSWKIEQTSVVWRLITSNLSMFIPILLFC